MRTMLKNSLKNTAYAALSGNSQLLLNFMKFCTDTVIIHYANDTAA